MNSVWRKLTALLLAVALCFSMGATAWAAENGAEAVQAESNPSAVEVEREEESELKAESYSEPEPEPIPEEVPRPEAARAVSEERSVIIQPEAVSHGASDRKDKEESTSKRPWSLLAQAESLPDVEQDKDLISAKEAFVRVGKNKTISLKRQPKAEAYFVSKNDKMVSVKKTGTAMVIRGEAVGRTVVEMRRTADDTLLDSVTVYGFQPSTTKQASGSRENPGDLTVSGTAAPTRTYDLTCQKNQNGKSYKKYLSAHGCTICSVTSVCSAYGSKSVNVDWLMKNGLEEIALRSGTTLKDKTLGYYGMHQVLEYAGISSKVYNWKNDDKANVEAAKEELVKALSAGRPVMLFIDKKANDGLKNLGTLFGDMHCVTLVGINDSGKLLIINSIYPQGINTFKYQGKVQKLEITPGELVDCMVRDSKTKRKKEDDFYFTKSGGLYTFLEVTCDKASMPKRTDINDVGVKLAQTSYTYTGEAFTPKVTIGNLKENTDYRVLYSDNIKAGTARVTVISKGNNCSGFKRLTFSIKKANGKITASDKTIHGKTTEQRVKLGATSKGNAAITYKSSDDSIKVDSSGVVTIPAGYVGTVTITLTSAETANVKAATKTVQVKVEADKEELTQGLLLVSDRKFRQSTKDRTVPLKPVAQEGAVFTYTSGDKAVKVSEGGVVTIPKEFVGVVKVKVKVTASIPDHTATGTDTPAEGETVIESRTVKITIEPRRVVKYSVKVEKKGRLTVKWNKANKVSGFQIEYQGDGKTRTLKVAKGSAVSAKIKGLKKGKKYTIRIRSYRTVGKTTLWSGWSGKKAVKAK